MPWQRPSDDAHPRRRECASSWRQRHIAGVINPAARTSAVSGMTIRNPMPKCLAGGIGREEGQLVVRLVRLAGKQHADGDCPAVKLGGGRYKRKSSRHRAVMSKGESVTGRRTPCRFFQDPQQADLI